MNIVRKNLTSLFNKVTFNICDSRVLDKVGYIYLNSAKDLNSLNFDMKKMLVSSVRAFEASSDVKVIVLLSKIEKAFCAGANIKEFQGKSAKDFENNDIFQ